jgi:hypothetical protein
LLITSVCLGQTLDLPTELGPPGSGREPAELPIERIDANRYRIGAIELDKATKSFSVQGRVIRDQPPLEFLVVAGDGYKAYESVLAVDANAFEFNLACIMLGLEGETMVPLETGGRTPPSGDPVDIRVSWEADGKPVSVPGSRLLMQGKPPRPVLYDGWVYTGSTHLSDGSYLADITGTLLGFVFSGESIIEHTRGLGIGDYGSVLANSELLPPVGTPVTLTVRSLK